MSGRDALLHDAEIRLDEQRKVTEEAEAALEGCREQRADLLELIAVERQRLAAVSAIVAPPCTCPGACSGPPRRVDAAAIRKAIGGEDR